MRVVVALGGNALLRRGQPMAVENQRENVRVACDRLAPIAEQHELIISHGNGPQIGLLALEEAAYTEVPESPLDVLGRPAARRLRQRPSPGGRYGVSVSAHPPPGDGARITSCLELRMRGRGAIDAMMKSR